MTDNVKKLDLDDVVFLRDSLQARLTDETRPSTGIAPEIDWHLRLISISRLHLELIECRVSYILRTSRPEPSTTMSCSGNLREGYDKDVNTKSVYRFFSQGHDDAVS